jgi:hypothetical protein
VNNVYVNSINHHFDACDFLNALPSAAIGEIHLAGHARTVIDGATLCIDTHDRQICADVWTLYEHALRRHGHKPTLIEWDAALPSLATLEAEAARADAIANDIERATRDETRRHPTRVRHRVARGHATRRWHGCLPRQSPHECSACTRTRLSGAAPLGRRRIFCPTSRAIPREHAVG